MSQILVVEDEAHLANGLRFNLEAEGYQVTVVECGEEALRLLSADNSFDVLVLDVMLPGIDGFEVMQQLRARGDFLPTLMLTARGHADDVLRGFAAGADDYLPKPFDLSILIARIRGLLRRRDWLQNRQVTTTTPQSESTIAFGAQSEKVLHIERQELSVQDQVFRLTLMETNLLRYLIQNEGRAISRKEMLEQVWEVRQTTDTRPIDNFIVRLRRYLGDDPANPKHVLTVRGVGYRFLVRPQ